MSVVAITGVSGYLGTNLLGQLEVDEEVEAIVGIDREPLPLEAGDKLSFLRHDLRESLGDLFLDRGVTHAVHLAGPSARELEADPELELRLARSFLNACGAAKARSVCVVSSVTVYGAHPDNGYLLEGSPLRPNPGLPLATSKAALEELCYDFVKEQPETALQIVRPCPILGPGAKGPLTRLLDARRIFAPLGTDARFQFVHEDDATRAIHRLLKSECFGVFNLAGDGSLTISQIAQLAERRLVRLPAWLLRLLAKCAWRFGWSDLHPGLAPFLYNPWLTAAMKVRHSAYFVPRYDSADALLAYLEDRQARPITPLEPFAWEAPAERREAPQTSPEDPSFGARPGLDEEDRAKTRPLGPASANDWEEATQPPAGDPPASGPELEPPAEAAPGDSLEPAPKGARAIGEPSADEGPLAAGAAPQPASAAHATEASAEAEPAPDDSELEEDRVEPASPGPAESPEPAADSAGPAGPASAARVPETPESAAEDQSAGPVGNLPGEGEAAAPAGTAGSPAATEGDAAPGVDAPSAGSLPTGPPDSEDGLSEAPPAKVPAAQAAAREDEGT